MNFLKNYGIVLVIPAVIIGLAGLGTLWDVHGQSAMVGESAPDFDLPVEAGPGAAEGAQLSLGDLRGKHVILDFWASYCPPCRRSVPVLNELQRDHSDTLQVVAVNVQPDGLDAVRAQHASLGWEAPTVTDRSFSLQEMYQVRALPTLVLIGPEGIVQYTHTGVPDRELLAELITQGPQEGPVTGALH